MALNEKVQALATFEDAADIGATAQRLGHYEEGHSLQIRLVKSVLSVIKKGSTPVLLERKKILVN